MRTDILFTRTIKPTCNFANPVMHVVIRWFVFFLSGCKSVQVFYHLFISVLSLEIYYQRGNIGIPLAGLALPHVCVCPKPGYGCHMSVMRAKSMNTCANG